MADLISRQAAINVADAVWSVTGDKNVAKVWAQIKDLPSAEPEIIRCKDCKWKQGAECVRFADVRPFADDFCSRAERRTDESFNCVRRIAEG